MAKVPALLRTDGQELAIPEEAAERNKAFALKSKSERTLKEYARCWRQFEQWCDSVGRNPLPLPKPRHRRGETLEQREEAEAAHRDSQLAVLATLATYVTWLASGQGSGKPQAVSTINQALSAIKFVQNGRKCGLDYTDPDLNLVVQGARRQISQSRVVRRVQGISAEQLADLLGAMDPAVVRDARDAAVLGLGWAGCRRRSELVGLDWMERGTAKGSAGVLTIDEKGCHIQLMVSKTRQEGDPEYYAVPRDSVPVSVAAVENWARLANLQPGQPVFMSLRGSGHTAKSDTEHITWDARAKKWRARMPKTKKSLGAFATKDEAIAALERAQGKSARQRTPNALITGQRMKGQSVAQIIKGRLRQWIRKKHPRWKAAEVDAEVAKYSGHSMRVGHITDASERGVPTYKIQSQSGHKDGAMISVYSRVSEKFRDNSLRGVRGGL